MQQEIGRRREVINGTTRGTRLATFSPVNVQRNPTGNVSAKGHNTATATIVSTTEGHDTAIIAATVAAIGGIVAQTTRGRGRFEMLQLSIR